MKLENITIEGVIAPVVFASPTALEKRDELVAASQFVKTVTDAESAETAVDVLKQLKEFTRAIELSRKEVKTPIDTIISNIQNTAKELTLAVAAEAERLDRMIGNWNAKQAEIADKKRQEALAEERRIADEAQKKIDAALAAGASERKLEKIEDKAFAQLATAKAETAAITAPRFAGIANRPVWEYEVTDVSALYKAYPIMVKLTPIDAAIKAALNNGATLPGVTAQKVNRTSVR